MKTETKSRAARSATRAFTLTAAALAMALTACQKEDAKTPGQKLDAALEQAQRKGDEAKVAAEKGLEAARSAADDAAKATDKVIDRAADATREPREKAAVALGDAAVTAKIKAKLAQDSELSALAVTVETTRGQVRLGGTAPTAAAKDRAATLARSVDGVEGVSNDIAVQAK